MRLLREYIAIDTSEPDANEIPGAEFLAAQLAAAGLEPHVERLADGRANVWAFVEGEDPQGDRARRVTSTSNRRRVRGAGSTRRSAASIDGPWMYGRGIYDMKSLTIAQLLATIDVAREAAETGRKPKRSILFLATSGEETGSETGTRWILRAHPELVARMGVVLTEGGVVEATSADEVKYWGIEFAQKRFTEIVFCSADAAQARALREVLAEHDATDPVIPVSEPVALFLSHYGPTRGLGSFQAWLADPAATLRNRAGLRSPHPVHEVALPQRAHAVPGRARSGRRLPAAALRPPPAGGRSATPCWPSSCPSR